MLFNYKVSLLNKSILFSSLYIVVDGVGGEIIEGGTNCLEYIFSEGRACGNRVYE